MVGPVYERDSDRDILLISDEDRKGREAYIFLCGEGVPVTKPERVENARLDGPGAPVWIELSHSDAKIDDWLTGLGGRLGGAPATIVIPEAMLDLVAARLDGAEVEILVQPDHNERVTALALMRARNAALASSARETSEAGVGADIERLSQEVARIASSLAVLTERSAPGVKSAAVPTATVDIEQVRGAIRARRARDKYFDAALFSDPAWDMLLELTEAQLHGQDVPVSSLCMASAVPPTTALRWIRTMTARGIFVRVPDRSDGRRVFVELAPDASRAMQAYFADVQGKVSA